MLYRAPPQPRRATKETRRNTRDSLLEGYNQPAPSTPLAPGHDQALFDPQYGVGNLQRNGGDGMAARGGRGRRGRGRGQQHNHNNNQNAGPSIMANGNNCCFAVAAFLFLVAAEVDFVDYFVFTFSFPRPTSTWLLQRLLFVTLCTRPWRISWSRWLWTTGTQPSLPLILSHWWTL